MKRIKLLPDNLINQIAAGEVIERPASIVKELLENSIDAGASRVEIEISNECRNIRIADNGHGIHKDDAVLAFSRHATSKLQQENDLWNISTLGFRGEALASIISVAKVSCLTRTADSQSGIKVDCENSQVKISETGCAIGTIMEVKDLFYNIPARMKFLKKNQTELASIVEAVQGIAISYPEVSIHLIHKGHSSLRTTGSNDLATVISEIYSKELIRELAEIAKEDTQFKLEVKGFASNPDFTRSNKKAIYLFINGRTVKCPIISKAIDNAYRDIIPSGRYPFVVLDLMMPSNEVDVNVHPAKREVRYVNSNQIFNFVFSAVKSALETNYSAYQSNSGEIFDNKTIHMPAVYSSNKSEPSKSYFPVSNTSEKVDFASFKNKVEKSIEFYSPPEQSQIKFSDIKSEVSSNKPKIIGQLANTYILLDNPDGLQIIDQHIAHERTLYEKLKETKNYASQLLLTSDIIRLEPSQLSLLVENKEILSRYGYEFELITDREITLRQVPQMLVGKEPEKIIHDIITALESSLDAIEDEILITTACHAAVKANEKLSIWQMEELITNWQLTKLPKTCPHGRIISKVIPYKDIAGFFGRPNLVER